MGKVIYFDPVMLDAWMRGEWKPNHVKEAATHVTLNPVG
jgi:hypothetical protein